MNEKKQNLREVFAKLETQPETVRVGRRQQLAKRIQAVLEPVRVEIPTVGVNLEQVLGVLDESLASDLANYLGQGETRTNRSATFSVLLRKMIPNLRFSSVNGKIYVRRP